MARSISLILKIPAGFLLSALFTMPANAEQNPSYSQEPTRAAAITAEETNKSLHLQPTAGSKGEQAFLKIERRFIDPVFNPSGLSLKLGGLPTGGGFSAGPRYTRNDLFNDTITSDSYVVGSTKLWWRGETALIAPSVAHGHLRFRLDAAYENAASVQYFGEGPTTKKAGKSNFRREFSTAHFETGVHTFNDRLVFGYRIGGLLANIGPGRQSDPPSTDTIYTEQNTPGLDRQSHFITGTSFADLDFTKRGFRDPSGARFQVQNTQFWDKSRNAYSFNLLSTQGEYYFTFANGMRTLALRARNETAFTSGTNLVPFYLQPTIGGADDLRGYDRYRFYGNGSSVVNVEYRWPLTQIVEFALFVDGGNVYERPGLIGIRHTRGNAGIGARFKNKDTTFMRFDIGASPEGVQLWFVFNPNFGHLSHSY